jgi:hypothetical protein
MATNDPITVAVVPKPELTVAPRMKEGANVSVQTSVAGGTNFIPFAAQKVKRFVIVNNTGVTIEFKQDNAGVAVGIPDGSMFEIYGINDASQISVRRTDGSTAQVTVTARWEA